MDNGGVFFVAVIGFFFLLWVAGGGPSRPISFAGPYITPITNENETQTGYGPPIKLGGTINLPGASISAGEHSAAPANSIPNTSSYAGLVTVTHVAGTASVPDGFVQISVSSNAGKDIDITGWHVKSYATSVEDTIPTAVLLLRLGATNTLQDIVLRPGDKATVTTATSAANVSFEANACTGYLASKQADYNPCVTAHANDPGFLSGTWYAYLARTTMLWETSRDTIELLDASNKVVATASY